MSKTGCEIIECVYYKDDRCCFDGPNCLYNIGNNEPEEVTLLRLRCKKLEAVRVAASWFIESWATSDWLEDGYPSNVPIECEWASAEEIRDTLIIAENDLKQAIERAK